jgi:hypothetical protein
MPVYGQSPFEHNLSEPLDAQWVANVIILMLCQTRFARFSGNRDEAFAADRIEGAIPIGSVYE